MSLHMRASSPNAAVAFPPFEKGGQGGFAFDFRPNVNVKSKSLRDSRPAPAARALDVAHASGVQARVVSPPSIPLFQRGKTSGNVVDVTSLAEAHA